MSGNGKTIESGQHLHIIDASKGEYTVGYELFSPDQGDFLKLTVGKGKLSVWVNEQWRTVSGSFDFQDDQNQSGDSLKIRVNSKAGFSFSTVDGYSTSPYSDASTNPSAQFVLADRLESDTGDCRSGAWKVGRMDALTGVEWNEGIVGGSDMAGIHITETIGGDDVSDYAKFNITKAATVQIEAEGAIAQLLNSKGMVVADSSDGYQSLLTATLKRGTYYLGFSSESSTAEVFTSTTTFM